MEMRRAGGDESEQAASGRDRGRGSKSRPAQNSANQRFTCPKAQIASLRTPPEVLNVAFTL
eukprot:3184249-Pleurochrysis_carterae.AAC.2